VAQIVSGAVLAAGRGERLRAASGGIPKALVEINGEPLLMRQVRMLRLSGARPLYVIVNSETYRLMCDRELEFPEQVDVLVRDTPNSMESLLALGERIGTSRFILVTVDAVLQEGEFAQFVMNATNIASNPESRLDGALGVVRWRGDRNPLFAHLADNGMITALGDRPSRMVTAGVYLFSRTIYLHAAEAHRRQLDAMRRFLALLLEKSMRFAAVEMQGVVDLDDSTDLEAVRALLKRKSE
jgi:choline kinase